MKAIYFLLLILSFVTDVIAADITVTSDSSSSYILNVNDTLTINSGVNINSIGIPITVNDSIEINNYGNVTCSSSVNIVSPAMAVISLSIILERLIIKLEEHLAMQSILKITTLLIIMEIFLIEEILVQLS